MTWALGQSRAESVGDVFMCNCFSEHQSPPENSSVPPQETRIDPETLLLCPVPCSPDQTQLEEATYFAKGRGDGETQFGRVFGS